MKMYYMFNLGWHLEAFLKMAVIDGLGRPDMIEMSLHHFVTAYLVGGSYLVNLVRIGALIEWIHDTSDVFVCIARTLTETKLKCP